MSECNVRNEQDRNQIITTLLGKGHSLSDIQKMLLNDHQIQITYMELRLISSELEVDWKKIDKKKPKATLADKNDQVVENNSDSINQDLIGGKTSISLSKVLRPGSMMSGDVTFKSGATAEWSLDALGRLALNPTANSPKATEEDLSDFQLELQKVLQGQV